MDLNEVLSEETKTEVVTETPVVEAEPEKTETPDYTSRRREFQKKEWEAQGRDPETGQFIKKEETKEEVKTDVKVEQKKEEFTDRERAFLKATEEERKKRQALEQRLADLEKGKQPEKTEAKSFWDDPEGKFKEHEQRLSQKELALTLKVSEQIARSRYTDFDEKIEAFAEVLQKTPGLHAQWLASQDPAEFAYRTGEGTRLLKDAGSIDKLKEQIRKEERERLETEYKAKQEALEKERAALPGSLSEVRGVSRQQRAVYTGPTPLDAVLSGKD